MESTRSTPSSRASAAAVSTTCEGGPAAFRLSSAPAVSPTLRTPLSVTSRTRFAPNCATSSATFFAAPTSNSTLGGTWKVKGFIGSLLTAGCAAALAPSGRLELRDLAAQFLDEHARVLRVVDRHGDE